MAVQAQYPSNILLLNRNNGQEGLDYSLQQHQQQQHQGSNNLFLDQSSSVIFNNVGAPNNPRKRAREASISTQQINTNTNFFSLHHQQQQNSHTHNLIDLSQNQIVSTGLRLSITEQQQQFQQQQQQQQKVTNHTSSSSSNSSSLLSILSSQDLASQIKLQTDELEQFLQSQGEQLRRTIAEKRQRHYRALICAAEESITQRLKEKDSEIEKATRRNLELESRAGQISLEAQLWQSKARAQESLAAQIQAQIQEAILMGPIQDPNRVDDAQSGYADPDRVGTEISPSCRACRKRVASVVLLPCRHLAVCTDCDRLVRACPVCHAHKNSSVEVFLC